MRNKYNTLHQLSKKNALLASIERLLEWDQETYMPAEAITIRGLQLEEMATIVHKAKTSARFTNALKALIDLESGRILDESLSEPQKSALKEWRRDYLKTARLPASFVKNFAKTTSQGIFAWIQAKESKQFSDFSPHLEKIVSLCRKKADYLGFQEHPYDALLDLYEPLMRTSYLTPLFERLQKALTALLKKIEQPKHYEFLTRHFPADKQMAFGEVLLHDMGFSKKTSRLDLSAHPFCTCLHPKDTRMTTRIYPDHFLSNIFSVIHEGGHGLYSKGLPEEHFGSPLGEPISYGLDESQSRWWETRIGRARAFWTHYFPKLQKEFPDALKGVNLEEFYKAVNIVKPSLIRIESDEVTYSLHIILRFEIEKALIEGTLAVKDIPEVWRAKMQAYLGITPTNDAEGCLQDIHWSMGGIGYFPTYALGNLYAAQFFLQFEKQHPDWQTKVASGELTFIREWLKENIHQFGRRYTPHEIVMKISGRPLSEKPFIDYLENKYIK